MKLVLNNVLNLLGMRMLALAIWNMYLFYYPSARKQKLKQNRLYCTLPFVSAHTQYFHTLMSSIICLQHLF